MGVIGVIPARWGSSRFPGKPLANILGKPMVRWVWEAAQEAKTLDRVIVATDDERIEGACKDFGAEVIMTDPNHNSGSDRVAEVAGKISGDIYVNIQGDEPLLAPENIDLAVTPFFNNESLEMSTLKTDIRDWKDLFDTNVVKVVTDLNDFALYFSRLPIPFARGEGVGDMDFSNFVENNPDELKKYYKQIGLYVFRKDFLFRFTSLPPSKIEQTERLEQLRALENGYRIKVPYTDNPSEGVDSPDDIVKIVESITKDKDEA